MIDVFFLDSLQLELSGNFAARNKTDHWSKVLQPERRVGRSDKQSHVFQSPSSVKHKKLMGANGKIGRTRYGTFDGSREKLKKLVKT